ncbi:hypothetical protein OG909_25015 [Streptomyces sp. NBC_01754]|uniref:DUF6197 family protein n=1 Tax=Streptomyces sp. NBC_01754 TaxID=2975930 RepID=UPI002DD9D1C9|nr:hypothetical protein [Streptomyces sp. NBC_01754]WSC95276.1 hypothetical protein OG909_25015 [Streptomyces sp. NBC_01754]
METVPLTPDQLDAQASRLHDTDAWRQIVTGWQDTAAEPVLPDPSPRPVLPEPVLPTPVLPVLVPPEHTPGQTGQTRPTEQTGPARGAEPAGPAADWRGLLSVSVGSLVEESLRTLPTPAPRERPLPGRLAAMLPDRLHTWRRIGQPDVRPSVHLGHARRILTEWGWQNTPYRLRDARGARCLCGAMLTAHRLGYGSLETVDRAGAWLITELRSQGWSDLIGPWNRQPGRTESDALALLDATIRRASRAGH